MIRAKYFCLIACTAIALANFTSCKNAWEEHSEITLSGLDKNLLDQINANTELSGFKDLLVQTGYDTVLKASVSYTVWAPNNAAVAQLDPTIKSNPVALKQFVLNHISVRTIKSSTVSGQTKVKMLTGKNQVLTATTIDDASITKADMVASNGVLNIIDKNLLVKKSIWEYIKAGNTSVAKNIAFINFLDYTAFDPTTAEQTGIDPLTGLPIYKPGTGIVPRNAFIDATYSLKNEDSTYTVILLTDAAYDAEKAKLTPYFNGITTDSTTYFSQLHEIRDMVFPGSYTLNTLPDTLVSKYGAKVAIDKSAIVGTPIKMSNGTIIVMNKVDIKLESRLRPTIVQGEAPTGYSQNDKRDFIFFRDRIDPQGKLFNDIMARGHAVSKFYIAYNARNLYSTKYKVYWRAVNDVQTNVFQQRLVMGDVAASTFPYTDVPLNNYSEIYLGEYDMLKFKNLPMFLMAANTTALNNNTLTLDYIKLVPVIK